MHWLMALTVVTTLLPPEPFRPGFLDAVRLQALCNAEGSDAVSARSLCLGYVTGAVDQLLNSTDGGGRATICPPPDLTPKLALMAVLRRARYASTATGVGAADFVRFVLEQAYPCPFEPLAPVAGRVRLPAR